MASEIIDFAELALSRLAQQYRDKPKYVQLVQELSGLVQSGIDDPLEYLITLYDINTAEGHNLDVIGEIVGQPRVLVDYDLFEFFGYDGSTGSGTYGDAYNANSGARYLSSGEDIGGDKTLSDAEYRVFIRARILKNYSNSTTEDIIASAKLILGVDLIKYAEGVMSIDIYALGDLDSNDLALIQNYDILPRPTGVEIASVSSMPLSIDVTGGMVGEFDFVDILNNRPNYSKPPIGGVYFHGSNVWLASSGGETWTNPSTDTNPPKTGWSTGSLGSSAITISY